MENKNESKKLLTHFTVTTALMGALFMGADLVQTSSESADLLSDRLHDNVVTVTDSADPAKSSYMDDEAYVDALSTKPSENKVFINALTLVNETLENVLTLLEKWTDKIIIIGNNLPKATFNLNIPMPLSREEAISVLKSLLSANGIAVTPVNDKTLRVVPSNRAKSNSPEIVSRETLHQRPGSQEICCCLFRLENMTAREGARTVMPWLTPLTSSIVTLDKANSLFVTDMLSNLQQLDKILSKIDKVGDVKEAILFFTPKNASAESLKANFESLRDGALKCYLYGTTNFAADKATNLFTVVTPKGNEALIRQFVEKLDVNVDPLVQHHVFRIQHGSAKDTTELIKKLMQQQKQSESALGNSAKANSNGDAFSKQLTLECDERLNAIVACGTPSDIRQIQNLINQLDVVLPQVRIEVVIAEVALTKGQASGLETFGYSNLVGGENNKVPSSLNKINIGSAGLTSGTSIFTINQLNFRKFGMDAVINAAKTNSNVSILSSPTLLTTHAREALLKITETRPYLSSVQTKTADAGAADISNHSITKEDAGIELTVKPLIGTNGIIQLEIDQKVDSFSLGSLTIGKETINLPNINRREAKSFVSVKSGEMLVLAGLKKKNISDTKKKMFLVGDIPLIGDALFSSKSKEETVTEMIIFIRPFLLNNETDVHQDTNEYTQTLVPETQEEVNSYVNTGNFSKKDIFQSKKRRHVKRPALHGKRSRLRQEVQNKSSKAKNE
ncbi:MAG: secretin N-terminal domain-containing protein [bacterium]